MTRPQEESVPEEADVSISPGPAIAAVSRKRSAEVSGQYTEDEPFTERAYTVAQNLGMLSLNIDSPQKHYLGSSSGLLFTNLIGASPPNAQSTPEGSGGYIHAGDLEWHDHVSSGDCNRKYYRELYNLLKQVSSSSDAPLITSDFVTGTTNQAQCYCFSAHVYPLDTSRLSIPGTSFTVQHYRGNLLLP